MEYDVIVLEEAENELEFTILLKRRKIKFK